MKIRTTKERLEGAVVMGDGIVSRNPTLPILKCFLLEAKKNVITIKATNLDLGLRMEIPARVEVEGSVAIPGNILKNFVSNVRGENIVLE